MSDHGTDYPDSEPNTLGDLKSIERLPQMLKQAPAIRWGSEYLERPIEQRLRFAERLAASMNHAADILQTERIGMIEVAERQEALIKQLRESYSKQSDVVEKELGSQNAARNELNETIVALRAEIRELKKAIAGLEGDGGDHG